MTPISCQFWIKVRWSINVNIKRLDLGWCCFAHFQISAFNFVPLSVTRCSTQVLLPLVNQGGHVVSDGAVEVRAKVNSDYQVAPLPERGGRSWSRSSAANVKPIPGCSSWSCKVISSCLVVVVVVLSVERRRPKNSGFFIAIDRKRCLLGSGNSLGSPFSSFLLPCHVQVGRGAWAIDLVRG